MWLKVLVTSGKRELPCSTCELVHCSAKAQCTLSWMCWGRVSSSQVPNSRTSPRQYSANISAAKPQLTHLPGP